MFDFNREVIKYVNNARVEPKTTARVIQDRFKNCFLGTEMQAFGKVIDTFEGVEAVEDLQSSMGNQVASHPLKHSKTLDQAAQEIAQEKGREGRTDNEKPKTIYDKIQKYGQPDGRIGELVSLAASSADEIVTYFLVDDGLASRKRRRMLLDPAYRYMGVGHAVHAQHGFITVILLAEILEERDNYFLEHSRLNENMSEHSLHSHSHHSHSHHSHSHSHSNHSNPHFRNSGMQQSSMNRGSRVSNGEQPEYRRSGLRESKYD